LEGQKTREDRPEISRFSIGRKDHERHPGIEPKNQARNRGVRGSRKDQAAIRPEKRERAEKTIERIRPKSGSKKTAKRKTRGAKKDHQRRAKAEMVFAAEETGKKREQAALNHAA
jgi:hypothetical protein